MANSDEKLVAELDAVKRLLMLLLLKLGASQKEISEALDVSQATVSRMTPKKVEKIAFSD